VCGNKEFTRRKRHAETVKTRMAAYRAQTEPLLPYYGAGGCCGRSTGWPRWTLFFVKFLSRFGWGLTSVSR